jgi:hypothetical protein
LEKGMVRVEVLVVLGMGLRKKKEMRLSLWDVE